MKFCELDLLLLVDRCVLDKERCIQGSLIFINLYCAAMLFGA